MTTFDSIDYLSEEVSSTDTENTIGNNQNLIKFPIFYELKTIKEFKPFSFNFQRDEYLITLGEKIYEVLFLKGQSKILKMKTAIYFVLFPNKRLTEIEIIKSLLSLKFLSQKYFEKNEAQSLIKACLNESEEFKFFSNLEDTKTRWMLNPIYFDNTGQLIDIQALVSEKSSFIVSETEVIRPVEGIDQKYKYIDLSIRNLGEKLLKLIFPFDLPSIYFKCLVFFILFPNNELTYKNILKIFKRQFNSFVEMKYHSDWKAKVYVTLFESIEFQKKVVTENEEEIVWSLNSRIYDPFGCKRL